MNEGCNDIDARSPLLLCCMTGTHDLISLAVAAELWIFPFQIRPTMNFSESDEKRKTRRKGRRGRLIYLIISFATPTPTPPTINSHNRERANVPHRGQRTDGRFPFHCRRPVQLLIVTQTHICILKQACATSFSGCKIKLILSRFELGHLIGPRFRWRVCC